MAQYKFHHVVSHIFPPIPFNLVVCNHHNYLHIHHIHRTNLTCVLFNILRIYFLHILNNHELHRLDTYYPLNRTRICTHDIMILHNTTRTLQDIWRSVFQLHPLSHNSIDPHSTPFHFLRYAPYLM